MPVQSKTEIAETPSSQETAEVAEALRVSTSMLEALLVQLNSWGHESAVNARGQIGRNEELLAKLGA